MAIGDRIDPKERVAFGVEFSCVHTCGRLACKLI